MCTSEACVASTQSASIDALAEEGEPDKASDDNSWRQAPQPNGDSKNNEGLIAQLMQTKPTRE